MSNNGRHITAKEGVAPGRLLAVTTIALVGATIAILGWLAMGKDVGITYLALGAFAALAANWGLALGFAELETTKSRVYSVPNLRPLDSESLHREPPSFLVDDATPKQNGRRRIVDPVVRR